LVSVSGLPVQFLVCMLGKIKKKHFSLVHEYCIKVGLFTYPGRELRHRIDLKVLDGFLILDKFTRRNICTHICIGYSFICPPRESLTSCGREVSEFIFFSPQLHEGKKPSSILFPLL
jgi:hypothetical protein